MDTNHKGRKRNATSTVIRKESLMQYKQNLNEIEIFSSSESRKEFIKHQKERCEGNWNFQQLLRI
jgi:hypothetical protein